MPLIILNKNQKIETKSDVGTKPKYVINRKEQEVDQTKLKESKIIIDGKEKPISDSGKYLLDMISEEE